MSNNLPPGITWRDLPGSRDEDVLWERCYEAAEAALIDDGGRCGCDSAATCAYCRAAEKHAQALFDDYEDAKNWHGPEPEERA